MNFSLNAAFVIIGLLTIAFPPLAVGAKAPLLEYKTKDDIDLPPIESRKIIGTWLTQSLPPSQCTRSFEQVGQKFYSVIRCSDGSGGSDGRQITRVSSTKFLSRTSTAGDHYVILSSGALSVRDKEGEVGVEPKSNDLWPPKSNSAPPALAVEDKKTVGLDRYQVGYRFGFTATLAMKRRPTNPAWEFVTPLRCRGGRDTERGIEAGTSAAW